MGPIIAAYIKANLLKLIIAFLLLLVLYRQSAIADDVRHIRAETDVMVMDVDMIKQLLDVPEQQPEIPL